MKFGKITLIILMFVLLTSLLSTITLAGYPDVDDNEWYYQAVTSLTQAGLMDGFPDGSFYPERNITSAEFLKLVTLCAYPDSIVQDDMTDISWDMQYYNAAIKSGIILVSDISESQINQPICRYNAALIVSHVLTRIYNEDISVPAGMNGYITDNIDIPSYYQKPVHIAYAAGILGGYSDGTFNGCGGITRAEAAQIIVRINDKSTRLELDSSKLSKTVEDDWFEDAMFIGDSLTHGLSLYGGLKTPDYYFSTGVSLHNIDTKALETPSGNEYTIFDALGGRSYGKVYILLGINQMGSNSEGYYNDYSAFIDTVKEYQPDAEIYLQTILPVSQSKNETSTSFTKENVEAFNDVISRLAEDKNARVVDIHSALVDENGFLPEYATWDGVHLNTMYYVVWADYLRSHT